MKFTTKEIDKELDEQYLDYGDIRVKKFLTIEEIYTVVKNCLEQQEPLKRIMVYYSSLTELATNVDVSEFIDENNMISAYKVYDTLAENGLLEFDDLISNSYHIHLAIEKVESIYNVAKGAVEELKNTANPKEMMESLAEATKTLKEQEAIHEDLFK